jgi:hypothetical protein
MQKGIRVRRGLLGAGLLTTAMNILA